MDARKRFASQNALKGNNPDDFDFTYSRQRLHSQNSTTTESHFARAVVVSDLP